LFYLECGELLQQRGPTFETAALSRRGIRRKKGILYGINKLTRVYPKVSGLAAWSKNCKWYSSLPLGEAVLPFCESV
jgi:hypothetical protein